MWPEEEASEHLGLQAHQFGRSEVFSSPAWLAVDVGEFFPLLALDEVSLAHDLFELGPREGHANGHGHEVWIDFLNKLKGHLHILVCFRGM